MKSAFLDSPEAWTRASRGSMTPADYGSAITVYGRRPSLGDRAVLWASVIAGAGVLLAAWMGVL